MRTMAKRRHPRASPRSRIGWSSIGPVTQSTGRGELGAGFRVTEIGDAQARAFPGFDNLILSFSELQAVIGDSRYEGWREVLRAVQGICLIADRKTGQLYIGKADGSERILGRWSVYAKTGHGGTSHSATSTIWICPSKPIPVQHSACLQPRGFKNGDRRS